MRKFDDIDGVELDGRTIEDFSSNTKENIARKENSKIEGTILLE